MLARVLLLGLLALVGLSFPAWATGPANYPPGGSGSGVVANTCTSGDFFSAVDGSGNFTCATPAGSGDVTAVGDCASGACFDGTSGTTLTGSGASTVLQGTGSLYFNLDTNADSSGDGFVVADNSTGTGGTKLFEINESNNAYLYNNMALRFREATANGSSAVIVTGPASMTTSPTIAFPEASGTVAVSATSPLSLSAAGDLSITADGIGSSQLAATFTATTITSNLVGNVTGNADTATTLAANPADCSADTYATTIAASGALTCSTVTNAGLAGSIAVSKTLLSAGFGLDLSGNSLLVNGAEWTGPQVWGDGSGTMSWTFNTGITDPIIDFYNTGVVDVTGTLEVGGVAVLLDGTGTVDVTNLASDSVTEAKLKAVDSPGDEECLTYESTGGDFEWQSCGSGSGISGIAADSGGTTTGSTVTITGTGTDTTRSTDTISVDVDMTEVSLTKGSIWQGNSSNVATAYSNPSGFDVRAFGAACDGSTDDSTAFTNCIAAVDGTDEGTCLVPATGNACVIADVTLTSNSNLVCTPGARLEAKSSVSNAMLYASSAINNVRISGCLLNLDQVEKDAIKINSGSTGITIDGNQFWWNYNSETAGTGTTAEDYIEMGCADSSSTTLGCSIRNNLFVGSNRDAQDDTGITVLDGGGILGLGSTFLIEGNIIAGTGGDCMDLTMTGVVNANLMYGCGEAGITGAFAQGVISSNEIYVNSSGGTFTIDINASNARIVGNNFPTNTSGRGAARIYNGSGTQFENNYAADGVQYLTVAITNRTNHAAIKNNEFNASSAMDDPFDGGSAVASVIVENPSDLQVVSNSFVGTAPAGGYTAIRIQNSDTATFDVAQTRILNNIISAIGAAGTDSCMLFHDASGTANNGFINMQIVANSCGAEGSTAIDNCVKVNNVAEAGNWSDVFYSANIFDDCTTWQNGASTTNVTPQVFNSAGTSFKWEPRGMNDGFQFRSIHMMGDGNCVPAAGTGYMGPISTGGNNCNATETNVDWSVGPNQVSFTNMTCRQNEDTSCTVVFTLRDDAADTSATCTTTNNDTCAWSGTVTMAASSLAAIKMSTNTSCTTESNIECDLTFTVD